MYKEVVAVWSGMQIISCIALLVACDHKPVWNFTLTQRQRHSSEKVTFIFYNPFSSKSA